MKEEKNKDIISNHNNIANPIYNTALQCKQTLPETGDDRSCSERLFNLP